MDPTPLPSPEGERTAAGPATPRQREAAESTSAAPPTGTPPQPAAEPRRRTRLRTTLIVVAAAVAVVCLGGLGVGYVAYDKATAPDLSHPDVAVSNYLREALVNRNDDRADQYTCGHQHLSQVEQLRDDLVDREKRFGTSIAVSWGKLTVRNTSGDTAHVSVDLRITASAGGAIQQQVQNWDFEVRDRSGWQVCGASRTG